MKKNSNSDTINRIGYKESQPQQAAWYSLSLKLGKQLPQQATRYYTQFEQ